MIRRDYYLVLGVPRTATAGGIKRAFRELAKVHHPDQTGSQEAATFKEILEAYEVLSDPERRRAYDAAPKSGARGRAEDLASARTARRDPFRRRDAEILVPEPFDAEPLVPGPMSVPDDFRTQRPSAEALMERLARNFTGLGLPKSEHPEALNVEVVLSPAAAARGGLLELRVPVFAQCAWCAGSGRDWYSPCRDCRGRGVLRRDQAVRVRLPGGIRQGSILELPLASRGIANFYLRLHVRVSPYA